MAAQSGEAQKLIASIYEAVVKLEKLFEGRRFTPDGILVGSLGEVIAEIKYEIKLLPPNSPKHDAVEPKTKRQIQIKTNQGDSAYLSEEPDYFIALKLLPDGKVREIYNGPGGIAWKLALQVKKGKNGYYAIRHTKLIRAMEDISSTERIQRRLAK